MPNITITKIEEIAGNRTESTVEITEVNYINEGLIKTILEAGTQKCVEPEETTASREQSIATENQQTEGAKTKPKFAKCEG